MRYGICTGPENLGTLEQAGYDYAELNLSQVADLSEEAFESLRQQINLSLVKPEACNCFFPGNIKVVGENADLDVIRKYVRHAISRAALLGVESTVVGSGGARRIPDGMSRDAVFHQFLEVLRIIGEEAEKVGITAAVEPLNTRETNFILTLAEGLEVVTAVNHPHVKLLADFYHMRMDLEPMSALLAAKGILHHVHIAKSAGRAFPSDAAEDTYLEFFRMLRTIGYDGRISVEGGTKDLPGDAVQALEMMKQVEAEAATA